MVRETEFEKPTTLARPEATKRKASGPIQPPAKKTRKEVLAKPKSPEKSRRGAAKKVAVEQKLETKTEVVVGRKTRSMDAKEAKDCSKPAPEKKNDQQKVFQAPPAKKASPKKREPAPKAAKTAPAQATRSSLRGRQAATE